MNTCLHEKLSLPTAGLNIDIISTHFIMPGLLQFNTRFFAFVALRTTYEQYSVQLLALFFDFLRDIQLQV